MACRPLAPPLAPFPAPAASVLGSWILYFTLYFHNRGQQSKCACFTRNVQKGETKRVVRPWGREGSFRPQVLSQGRARGAAASYLRVLSEPSGSGPTLGSKGLVPGGVQRGTRKWQVGTRGSAAALETTALGWVLLLIWLKLLAQSLFCLKIQGTDSTQSSLSLCILVP